MECGAVVFHLDHMAGDWTFEGLRFLLIGLSLCFWIFFFFFEFSTIFCCNITGTQCTASDFSHPFLFIFNEIFVYFSERGSVMLPLNGIEDKNLYFIWNITLQYIYSFALLHTFVQLLYIFAFSGSFFHPCSSAIEKYV